MKITIAEWLEKFKPIANHLDENASWQDETGIGIMYETYGEELAFVKSMTQHDKVWVMYDTANGGVEISNGIYLGQPIGYFVTQEPYNQSTHISVTVIPDNEETYV